MGMKGTSGLLLLLSALILPSGALGADFHGRSSTQVLGFENVFSGEREIDLAQYLRLSVTNVDKKGKASFYGYGRFTQDVTAGEGNHGRLYYLYGDFRDILDLGKVDLRIGRQFVSLPAGSALIDGAQVDIRNIGLPLAITLVGGRDVVFGLSGELRDAGNTDLGIGVSVLGIRNTDLDVAWLRKWDDGDVARDTIGATASHRPFRSLKLYGNAKFDLATETFNEVAAGAKYYPTTDLILTGEWFQSYPTFDATSIYAVFAVDRYQEGLFRVDYAVNDTVSVNAGYTREEFGEGAGANVYRLGCSLRPVDRLTVNAELDKRQGYYGNLDGVSVDAAYEIDKKAQVAGGITYDTYRRDSLTNDEIARRYWLGGKYSVAKNMAASLRLENSVNERYERDFQGRLVLDYDF